MTNIIFALSLCRKAGALITGFDAVKDSVNNGKAHIVMCASDTSPNTLKRVGYFCEDIIDFYMMDKTQDELAQICKKPAGVFSVTNEELAKLCRKNLLGQPVGQQEEFND